MKNQFLLTTSAFFLALILAPYCILAQAVDEVHINPDMTLEIVLERAKYAQSEPINLSCSFINETDLPQTTIVPNCLHDGVLVVESGSEKKLHNQLSVTAVLLARRPIIFDPGKGVEEEITLYSRLDEFFPKPGTYKIRLAFVRPNGKLIESNSVELDVTAPVGINKEAFDFIRKYKSNNSLPSLFVWDVNVRTESGNLLLEEFVSKYGSSIYGEHAILRLAYYYRATEQFDKARIELEKLKFSKNPRIVKEAKSVL